MAKSKYPQELDTSAEIPAVRDNITEIGSDIINSLRSAIFNIEKSLGINPQGAAGNTLASRLSKSIDENGNILQTALDKANVLSGPISDKDVSRTAAIQENKLKLNFPTALLQDEISVLNSQIDVIQSAIEDLSISLSIHLNRNATNSHKAASISVDQVDAVDSDVASVSLSSGTVQNRLEEIYNSHINYSGVNISQSNKSHLASQIFFDNTNISQLTSSNSVQGVIEDLSNVEQSGFNNSLISLHSNGLMRSSKVNDDFENRNKGSILVSQASASYIQASGASTTLFSLTTPAVILEQINEFDVLTLYGHPNIEDNIEYQVSSTNIDGGGNLVSVNVYGGPKSDYIGGLSIEITKNTNVSYNSNGFNATVRPRSLNTNTPDVQIANPDCATIITSGIMPAALSLTNHKFKVQVDGGSFYTLETFDALVSEQTIDSIVNKINEQSVDQHLNFMAYKLRVSSCYELAVSHNMPNIASDAKNRTLQVFNAAADDGVTSLGFASKLGTVYEGSSNNSLFLNGNLLTSFGLIKTFDSSTIQLLIGSLSASIFSETFSSLGVRKGDLFIIDGSTYSGDDGTYRVKSILGQTVELDLDAASFTGQIGDTGSVHILRATAPVEELNFEEALSSEAAILFDVFITDSRDIYHHKRAEVDGSLISGPFIAGLSDISKNFILSGETAKITVGVDGYAYLTGPDLLVGESVLVSSSGTYKLFSNNKLSFVVINVKASGAPLVLSTIDIYGFNELSKNNYHICRGLFSTNLGRVFGEFSTSGVPTLIEKTISGSADHTIISETFIEKYIEGPRNELRSSGIISGCEISNAQYFGGVYQLIDILPGVYFANGIRFEFGGISQLRVNTGSEFYVGFDGTGCILTQDTVTTPITLDLVSPFSNIEVATLGVVTNDGATSSIIDLRLFVDKIDYKLIGDIKVSPIQNFGHFTSISKAVNYARRFSQMFPAINKSPSIFIGEGTYEVSEQILIDFDLKISGSGQNCIISKSGSLALGSALTGENVDIKTALFLIGGGTEINSDNIVNGVTLSNFTYLSSSSITGVGTALSITQPLVKSTLDVSKNAFYIIDGINFQGPSTINGAAADPAKIGEFALVVGQQNVSSLVPTSNLVMGNIIFKNCILDKMGIEHGAIKFTESAASTFEKIIISNNITNNLSPNVSDTSFIILNYPVVPLTSSIIEIGNV
jgi:hypothetical protein